MKCTQLFLFYNFILCICISCNSVVDAGKKKDESDVSFPWNTYKKAVIFSFDYQGISDRKFYEKDPLNLLGKQWTGKADGVKVIQQKKLDEMEFLSFRDSCRIPNSGGSDSEVSDCGFKPHHAFCLADSLGMIRMYELVCFWCGDKKTFGYKSENLHITGSYNAMYRFCQFYGFDFELNNPEALHSFATPEEIKCFQLRKTPNEVIHCDD